MIDFINVEKTYRSGVEALKGVSFTIEDGEFVFVIGKSGSGKSTLLKCITCEERPTSGKVTIDNFDISHMSRALIPVLRRRIGMIYQDFRLIDTKTVAENVAFAGEIIGVPKQSLMNTVQICLSVVGLKDKADCYPQELADEPTGNLDPETSEAIMAMLLEINKNGGTTVIICTHDSAMVDRMKQRVIEIDDGLISRDEKKSSYRGDQADHEAYMPPVARTEVYSGSGSSVAFGDDEEYGDNYDDSEYHAQETVRPAPGLFFGDDESASAAEPVEEEPFKLETEEVIEQEIKTEEPVVSEEIVEEVIVEEPVAEEVIPAIEEKAEEIIPEEEPVVSEAPVSEESVFSFGDEEAAAPVIPAEEVSAPDPDITSDSDLAFPTEETRDSAKEQKLEMKRKMREEKLAQKEAKRKEKLDRKKKVRRTDFMPGTDIDIFPEDEE